MAKVSPSTTCSTFNFEFFCPGCRQIHGFRTPDHPEPPGLSVKESDQFRKNKWTWNGDFRRPTISPSIHIHITLEGGERVTQCHSFVKDGNIQFLTDSRHALSGQTVEIPDYSE